MTSPLELSNASSVGVVESVSPNEIRVALDLDAPQSTALNTGIPTAFPRLNAYVCIPSGSGTVVGMVTWIGIESSPFPKRSGLKDFGVVDLPFPLRKLSVTPLGTLRLMASEGNLPHLKMERGVADFPSVGDAVHIPTSEQLIAIVESHGKNAHVVIGKSPVAANAQVRVDPDRMFGRHLAVLGNTGSGKSCTVAGLIRWSLEAATETRNRAGRSAQPNARFIVLDPNGEYAKAFNDLPSGTRVFQVPPAIDAGAERLLVPAWMWNSQEWSAFAEASARAQRPLLLRALREARGGSPGRDPSEMAAARRLRAVKRWLLQIRDEGGYQQFKVFKAVHDDLQRWEGILRENAGELSGDARQAVKSFADLSESIRGECTNNSGYIGALLDNHYGELCESAQAAIDTLPSAAESTDGREDAPVYFDVRGFADVLDDLAQAEPGVGPFIDTLTMRIRGLIADSRKSQIVAPANDDLTLTGWLDRYVGSDQAENGAVCVIDLSLVPQDVMHMVVAVLARLVFESTQRFRRVHKLTYPTVLVLEEAHSFIQQAGRGLESEEGVPRADQVCRSVFEKIAREGRKFGLGLVLASQRPSELSPTVLSQCNTFILHRIVNDRDQDLVGRLVPDNLGGLLRELPSLPERQAILLGWATAVPLLVEVNQLPEEHQPQSKDPEFWDVWVGEESAKRDGDWSRIVSDWLPDNAIDLAAGQLAALKPTHDETASYDDGHSGEDDSEHEDDVPFE